jgi:BON domain-containing protein
VSDRIEQQHEEVLLRAADVLDQAGIPYALMGGLAAATVGRERSTKDVDLFLTRKHEEVRTHLRPLSVLGREVPALSSEDIVVIKAIANAEHRPRHWHDALAILAATELDWSYFVQRARPHAARVVSLLLYAVSDGSELPAEPLQELFEEAMRQLPARPETEGEHHLAARVRAALATNPEIAEPEVSVVVANHQVIVRGEVATPSRKTAIEDLLRRLAPASDIRSELKVPAG